MKPILLSLVKHRNQWWASYPFFVSHDNLLQKWRKKSAIAKAELLITDSKPKEESETKGNAPSQTLFSIFSQKRKKKTKILTWLQDKTFS